MDTLVDVTTLRQPAGLGRLAAGLGTGPLGRWDEANVIELYMPGETLSSASVQLVLSGGNRILIENGAGWELMAWREAELVDTDRWHLSGLMRGLAGSPVRSVSEGAHAVLADDRLSPIAFSRDDFGRSFVTRLDDGEASAFTFNDKSGLPWRVGHLRGRQSSSTHQVSWTARGPDYSNNWDFNEVTTNLQYRVETYLNDSLVEQVSQTETEIAVLAETADLVRVAVVSAEGRVGEWGSIPL